MARFDIHRNRGADPELPYLVDVQADLLSDLKTRLVIPLALASRRTAALGRLNPPCEVEGVQLVLSTELMGAVSRRQLGARVGSLSERQFEITAAIDFLLQGF